LIDCKKENEHMGSAWPIRNGTNVHVALHICLRQVSRADAETAKIGFLDADGCFL
jgi:hypothetical protein